jgi:hypothetical protein
MNLQEHEQKDGFKIWLSEQEVSSLLDQVIHPRASIAFALTLGAKCGVQEIVITDRPPDESIIYVS